MDWVGLVFPAVESESISCHPLTAPLSSHLVKFRPSTTSKYVDLEKVRDRMFRYGAVKV
jgi:hypothetical protein